MNQAIYRDNISEWKRNIVECERRERPVDPLGKPPGNREAEPGPKRPKTDSPSKDNLMKRMRKVDPKQAERYRQRTGE
ncbi:MAG: ubiquitin-like protein UBact [Nitrospirales bacterium]|nr:ubiquitin-like protein UBact [Nitrospirales bacterium]